MKKILAILIILLAPTVLFAASIFTISQGGTATSTPPTAGKLFFGESGGKWSYASLTAGSNITISTTTTSITISSSAGGTGSSKWATSTNNTDIQPNDGQGLNVSASSTFSGNLFVRSLFGASSTSLFSQGITAYASSTFQNLTGRNATTTQATTTNLAILGITSKLLKTSADGSIAGAVADTDYQVPLTFGDGLTRTSDDIDCDTASGSVFGCLSAADWGTFNGKQAAITGPNNAILAIVGSTVTATSSQPLYIGNLFATSTATSTFMGAASTTRLVVGSADAMPEGYPSIIFSGCSSINCGFHLQGAGTIDANVPTSFRVDINSGAVIYDFQSTKFLPAPNNTNSLGFFGNAWNGAYASSTSYFENYIAGNSTTTNATTTTLSIASLFRSGTSDGCATWLSGLLTSTGAACGTGTGGGTPPFDPDTNYGVAVSATSTPIWGKLGLFASSTSHFVDFDARNSTTTNATTTTLTISNSAIFSTLTSAILLTGANGYAAEYAGTSCTNQFARSLDALGAATCATVGAGDVSLANLTATDSTLTFSGTYNGSTARTIGLNLSNGNVWTTASTTFAGGVTIFSATTTSATSTNLSVSGTVDFDGLTSALIITGSTGILAEYAGTTCTNQFARSLSALGAATCETVANTDLANSTISGIALGSNLADLTATNGTLTFSGSYNGGTARTIGLNLGNANTWTALQNFSAKASSTQFSVSDRLYMANGVGTTTVFGTGTGIGIATATPSATLQVFSTATGTVSADSNSATQGGCIEIKDSDGSGYVYITAKNGQIFTSTRSCK